MVCKTIFLFIYILLQPLKTIGYAFVTVRKAIIILSTVGVKIVSCCCGKGAECCKIQDTMTSLEIKGSNRLKGSIRILGSKNAALPILAAALMAKAKCAIHNVPKLMDIRSMLDLLKHLGAGVSENGDTVIIDSSTVNSHEAPYELVSKMRASFLVAGPLLATRGKALVSMPGGCAIGQRPVNLHLVGFETMGVKVGMSHGYCEMAVKKLNASRICLDYPSVGATENLMMAACLAKGTTFIENAAREPEIIDLADFLNAMGAKVIGAGSNEITIEGVTELHGATHNVIADRLEAGTLMIAAAGTRGDLHLEGARADHLEAVISKLRKAGVTIEEEDDGLRVKGPRRLKGVDLTALPYPGFPTDLQPQMTALLSIAEGTSIINETVFENRMTHVPELIRMGANIDVRDRTAVISGVKHLSGAEVMASDIRGGAALVVAGLIAGNSSRIRRYYHIRRGYQDIDERLCSIGADVKKVEDEENRA